MTRHLHDGDEATHARMYGNYEQYLEDRVAAVDEARRDRSRDDVRVLDEEAEDLRSGLRAIGQMNYRHGRTT